MDHSHGLRHRRRLGLFCMMSFNAIGWSAVAQEAAPAGDMELAALLSLLEEQTQLATKNRMNADYVPGMATILNGQELLARGARSVWEALALVPGISQGMEFTGERQALSRGIGHGYASGDIKILLDGISMNSSLLATANPVLNMPIEQVERIEVIRGPGSSVHGEYAYAGVVNVITRRHQRALHVQGGDGSLIGAGGLWHEQDQEQDLQLSLNIAGLRSDGSNVQVTQDALYHTGQQDLSYAPGPSNEAQEQMNVFFDLQWQGYFVALKMMNEAYGDHFGINHNLPPPQHRLASQQRYRTIELVKQINASSTLNANLRLEALEHERNREQLYVYPADYLTDYEIYMDLNYREKKYLGAADIHWSPHASHRLLLSLEYSRVAIDKATWDWPDLGFALPETWINPARKRHLLGIVVQDQWFLNEQVTATATLRRDDYSDVGTLTSPRLAAVWRINQEHIVKLQYAKAFRPPTFYEMQYSGKTSIDPSEISTYELGYIIKQPHWEGRLIVFESNLKNPLLFDERHYAGYINSDDVRLRGAELEYQQRLGHRWKLDANLSYVDSDIRGSASQLPGGANWLANVGVLWQPYPAWNAALQLRYVGKRNRADFDSRPALSAYSALDLTLTYRPANSGAHVTAGIKNLTDEDVRYPDQLTTDYNGEFYLPYPNDYPRPGRRWWLSAGYDF
jgi:outer membrane receptor for ferrienterochelin and colicins